MKRYGLNKRQKLCSTIDIDTLFARAGGDCHASLCYPLRCLWRVNDGRQQGEGQLRFLISVPKKRLRHAVDRVAMRRRVREAFRLSQADYGLIASAGVDLGLVYVADRRVAYADVHRSVNKLLARVEQELNPGADGGSPQRP
jgi:ribonuclease P protein component